MALLRTRLFAGALFAGALFGQVALVPETVTQPDLGGGGGFRSRSYQIRKKEPFILPIPIRYAEEEDEEAVILFLLQELRRREYI